MTNLENHQKIALCNSIKSSRYAKKVITLLRDISADLYRTDRPHGLMALESCMEEDLSSIFKEILEGADESDPTQIEERLSEVIDYLKQVEEINFTVPIHPSADFLKRLHIWCAGNIQPEILLEFTTNRLMESGLLMVYKGHYFLYTLENLLDEYFSSKDLSSYFTKQI